MSVAESLSHMQKHWKYTICILWFISEGWPELARRNRSLKVWKEKDCIPSGMEPAWSGAPRYGKTLTVAWDINIQLLTWRMFFPQFSLSGNYQERTKGVFLYMTKVEVHFHNLRVLVIIKLYSLSCYSLQKPWLSWHSTRHQSYPFYW